MVLTIIYRINQDDVTPTKPWNNIMILLFSTIQYFRAQTIVWAKSSPNGPSPREQSAFTLSSNQLIFCIKVLVWDDLKCCLIHTGNCQREENLVKEILPEEIKSGNVTKNMRSLFFHPSQKNVHNNWFWVVLTWCSLILEAGASWRSFQSQLNWWLPLLSLLRTI